MVLFYNQDSVPLPETPDPSLLSGDDVYKSRPRIYTTDTPQTGLYQENRGLLENLSRTLFGGSLEMETIIRTDEFGNLSPDEKIIYLIKVNQEQGRVVSSYLRLVLFILVMIVFKMYS
jgi:hypothetical protein